ncbi:Acetylornithine deacetylase/Succinyl-diaminopimelate desuccinylase and related deacylase [Rubrobacter radiotolerans]|uniref:Acetylornithine deacetylase/Succinyl-diaminopimelate desuccinylase and related deacylase n=1 Tax=Rubrobacter radiotolerans TaxID=42256 RepID=A0A023X557_RUBRA|nr:M20 family metallopeptidase [Rubrobacter radiotolerans]AHY47120.1 Acetylornithine deacetylase/Succinyl-diaminopimelate desuccinylase and related deacylase [Rubrobacter radiotolerans]MDX5894525.1 M20 family metallopeptidase [Rubrobacter radiotolerans]SMC06189.1 glutamate carboxypeptidase [Rubrobacter radiotolerans DSM 5868]
MSKLLQYLTERQGEMLADLEEFVVRESPSDDKERMDAFAEFLAGYAKGAGGDVEVIPVEERGNHLRITWGDHRSGEKPLLLVGHFDTVWPVGSFGKDPFRVEGGIAYGPGVFDMKGGLVQGFWAIKALHELSDFDRPVVFFCNSDEEVHSFFSRDYIEREAKAARAALVLESSNGGNVTTERKGVGVYEVEVTGREAHAGSNPFKGVSAVDEMARHVLSLHSHTDAETGTTVNVGTVRGGTRVNVIAGKAHAKVNLRIPDEREARRMDGVIRSIEPHHPEAAVEVSGGIVRPPMLRSEGVAALYGTARRVATEELGFDTLGETKSGGGSDGSFCAAVGTPTLDGLGAVGQGAHAAHEQVIVEHLPKRAALLARLMQEV